MLRQFTHSRDLAEIERRMQALERRFERLGGAAGRAASNGMASVSHATDRFSDALVSALGEVIDRFRGGARSVGGEAARFGQEAARFSHEAARVGNDALRRVTNELEHRPLVTLALAVGIGVLIGLAGRRSR